MKITKLLVTGERADKILQLLDGMGLLHNCWSEVIKGLVNQFNYRCVVEITIKARK